MEDMDYVTTVRDAVHALNRAVAAASLHGLTVEHEVHQFETMAQEPFPQIETTISRHLERAS